MGHETITEWIDSGDKIDGSVALAAVYEAASIHIADNFDDEDEEEEDNYGHSPDTLYHPHQIRIERSLPKNALNKVTRLFDDSPDNRPMVFPTWDEQYVTRRTEIVTMKLTDENIRNGAFRFIDVGRIYDNFPTQSNEAVEQVIVCGKPDLDAMTVQVEITIAVTSKPEATRGMIVTLDCHF